MEGKSMLKLWARSFFFPHWNITFMYFVISSSTSSSYCLKMYKMTNSLKKKPMLYLAAYLLCLLVLPLWSDQTSLAMEKWSGMPALCQILSLSLWWKCFGLQESVNLSCWLKASLQVSVLMCTVNSKSVRQRSLNVILKQRRGGAKVL